MNADQKKILDALAGGMNVVQLVGVDEILQEDAAAVVAEEMGLAAYKWSPATGLWRYAVSRYASQASTWRHEDSELRGPCDVLSRLWEDPIGGVWVLNEFHPYLRNPEAVRWLREFVRPAKPGDPRKIVLLCTVTNELPQELKGWVPTVNLLLPDRATLNAHFSDVARGLHVPCTGNDAVLDAVRGLTLGQARQVFGKVGASEKRLDATVVPQLLKERGRILQEGGLLELMDTPTSLDQIGGLAGVKAWLGLRREGAAPGFNRSCTGTHIV